jgi:deoxycytidylate deaminase
METINALLKEALSKEACFKHPVAAVIETKDEIYDYVLGWNGAPSGIKHYECSRKNYPSGEGMNLCVGIHAERRAISHAARKGISLNKGAIYLSEWFPCADCAKSIIEAGLTRLITPDELYLNRDEHILIPKLQNQPYNFEMAERLLREAGIELIVEPSIKAAK